MLIVFSFDSEVVFIFIGEEVEEPQEHHQGHVPWT